MKILGLFVVVFIGIAISKGLGFSETGTMVSAVMGSSSYIILLSEW
jgi:hypothetical protein